MNKNAKKRARQDYLKKKENHEEVNRRPLDIKEYKVHKASLLLDFLLENVKGQSRNNIKKILSRKCVAIDGAPITQFDFELSKGDTVIVSKSPIKPKNRSRLSILYEDDEFIVVDKPFGILSVANDKEKANTAYRYVTDYVQAKNKKNRIYVVHRIDRETSGVLMFCKNENIRDIMQEKWNDIVTKRGYYAVVDGKLKEKKGRIKSYLKMNKENMMYISKSSKNAQLAITNYEVMKENDAYSLLDVSIDSGRKNQIRVQLGELGNYIIGDDKYGEPTDPLNRLGLHAYNLTFNHPITNKEYKISSKIPSNFLGLFKR